MKNKHRLLISDLSTYPLAFIGETHGVFQNVEIISNTYRQFNFECLALEWFDVVKEDLLNYLTSGNLTTLLNNKGFKLLLEDGRASIQHLHLLKDFHNTGLLKNIILFGDSSSYTDWNTRDSNYFKNFTKQYNNKFKTLIIAGGLHSRVKPTKHKDVTDTLYPIGYLLSKQFGYFPSAKIKYLSGKYRNIGIKEFKQTKFPLADNKEFIYLVVEKAIPL